MYKSRGFARFLLDLLIFELLLSNFEGNSINHTWNTELWNKFVYGISPSSQQIK